jgi:hypothetical protein
MDILIGGLLGLGAAALVQTWLVWRATRSLARVATIEARLEKFGDAIALLTDTTESAFRAVAIEMTRPAPRTAPRAAVSAARTRRVSRAATKGATIQQIAAAEDVAEGEVRLRLQVANDVQPAAPRSAAPKTPAPKNARTNGRKREAARGALRLD